MLRWLIPAILGLLAAAPPVSGAPPEAGGRLLRISEFFETRLPGALGRGNSAIRLTPRLGDLRDREFVRLPVEYRLGLSERTDVVFGATPFAPGPFRSGTDRRWGLGEGRAAIRREWTGLRPFLDHAELSLEARVPLGRPPPAINDRFCHLVPGWSVARSLAAWPGAVAYANLSHDWGIAAPARPDALRRARRRRDGEIVPGVLYQPGATGTFLEHHFRRITEAGRTSGAPETRIGAVWDVPPDRSRNWRLPGSWQIAVAYRHFHVRREGSEFRSGLATRVVWRALTTPGDRRSTLLPGR